MALVIEEALSRIGREHLPIIGMTMVQTLTREAAQLIRAPIPSSNTPSTSLLGSVRALRIREISVLDFVLSMERESRDGSSL